MVAEGEGHGADLWRRLSQFDDATAGLDAPFAVVDVGAWRANANDLVGRAAGTPIRVASKSVRSRPMLKYALGRPGFRGVLAFTLSEALWLAGEEGDPISDDVVVAYPTADRSALHRLLSQHHLALRVTLMIDDIAQLDLLDDVRREELAGIGRLGPEVRVCIDLDASLRLLGGRVHLGVRRSPVHSVRQAQALARQVIARPGVRLVGLLSYEAQVAGLQDDAATTPTGRARQGVVRLVQAASMADLRRRRTAAVAAVRREADLEFVNGGGTGSVDRTAAERGVTEVAAGSGLYSPTLFDGYRAFRSRPAAFFALPVVRRPGPGLVTVLGGGWIASGPPGRDRLPVPVWPPELRLLPAEGAGEVQTPLGGAAAEHLAIGDRVWFRHAKAGELCEHVDALHLLDDVDDGRLTQVGMAATYRGEGKVFL